MFERILIANRGEIARRIIRTARAEGVQTVVVYSEADADALHVEEADVAMPIGPAAPARSYLDHEAIIGAALRSHAEAVHPGYGFLSESPDFAEAVRAAGLHWIGPDPATMRLVADKAAARETMAAAGVPVTPGGCVATEDDAVELAGEIGFPLMVKPVAGGGGIGMRVVGDRSTLRETLRSATTLGRRFFGDGRVLLESYFAGANHVEIQVVGLSDGQIVVLGERDCSVQRRHQKVIEETPSPVLSGDLRARMVEAAGAAARAVDYRNAGTVEFLVVGRDFRFLEINARLQVEHPITEMVTGIDLVAEQLRVASGDHSPALERTPEPTGHALELRIYAEDPQRFLPSPGTVEAWVEPTGSNVRVDSGYRAGDVVTPHYDPLLAKVCVWGSDRAEALEAARGAVGGFVVDGVKTNLPFLARVLRDSSFVEGSHNTTLVDTMIARADDPAERRSA